MAEKAISICLFSVFWIMRTFLVDSVVPGSYKITPDNPVAHFEVFQQSLDNMWEEPDKYWPFIEAQLDYCAKTAQYYSRNSEAGVAMSNWGFAMAKLGFYHMQECCKDVPLTKASAANHFQMVKDYCIKIMFQCGDTNGLAVENDVIACDALLSTKPGTAQLNTFAAQRIDQCLTRALADPDADATTHQAAAATVKAEITKLYGPVFGGTANGKSNFENCVDMCYTHIHGFCTRSMMRNLAVFQKKANQQPAQ